MIYDTQGNVHARAQNLYPTERPEPFFEQQDPELIKKRVYQTIAECVGSFRKDPSMIRNLAFSSQMYSILAVDQMGIPLTKSILWSDGRAEKEVLQIRQEVGELGWYERTGCPSSSIFPIAKIRWISNNLPEVFAAAFKFISIKEYVLYPLLGQYVVDYSMASATGLFDIRTHRWCEGALRSAGISEHQLSEPVSGTRVFEIKDVPLLATLGLADEMRLVLTGGDGPLANIGSKAYQVGAVNIDLGTSGAARVLSDKAITDPDGSLWCFCLTDSLWAYGGILSNVGNAFDWIATNILDQDPYHQLCEEKSGCRRLSSLATDIPAGAEGLIVLPYLRRARSPSWDVRLTGNIINLNANHTLGHLVRALIEAIGYDLRSIIALMSERVDLVHDMILSGGIARGENIAQIISSILERPLRTIEHAEASLAGAAIMGLYATGLLDSLRFDSENESCESMVYPDETVTGCYQKGYETYQTLVAVISEGVTRGSN
jgi:gluconokinase